MTAFLINAILFVVGFVIFSDAAYCDFDKIPFPGLKRAHHRLYLHGEYFYPVCDKGFTATKPGGKLTCKDGVWSGYFPPCVVANCLGPPPPIANGAPVTHSGKHMTFANYTCHSSYFLAGEYSVQCVQGEWVGSPPVCKDGRCHFIDLKKKEGILFIDNNITRSGEKLQVLCSKDYLPVGVTPFCSKGVWVEYGMSPCKGKECVVPEIEHGALNAAEERLTWKWAHLRRENETVYKKVKKGTLRQSGDQLQLACKPKYTFEGKGIHNKVKITCEKGQWIPKPVCLHG